MTKEEYEKLLDELDKAGETHKEEFDRWYDTANFPTIEHYCKMGWLISRVLIPRED